MSSSARLLALAIVARVPVAAVGLVLVITVNGRGHSYAAAGATSASVAIGMAVAGPLVGRLIDRRGQTAILLLSCVTAVAATLAFAALPASVPPVAGMPLALVIGAAIPPVPACARAIWSATLDERRFNRILTLDASLQELAFMAAPLLMVTTATSLGPTVALTLTAALITATTVPFACSAAARRMRGGAHRVASRGLGALRYGGVRMMVVVAAAMGMLFGATELGIVVTAREHGAPGATSILLAVWGVGSITVGLLAARWPVRLRIDRWLTLLLAAIALSTVALAVAPTLVVVGAVLVVAGAAVAPLFATTNTLMARMAPDSMLTEAYGLQSSGLMAGVSVGSGISGVLVDHAGGAPAAFVLAAVAPGAVAIWVGLRPESLGAHPHQDLQPEAADDAAFLVEATSTHEQCTNP